MQQEQALAVVYDLALTIGREITLDALLTKCLQRFMFHTASPTGLVLHHPDTSNLGVRRCTLLKVIGNFALQQQTDQLCLSLPDSLFSAHSQWIRDIRLIGELHDRLPARGSILHLPIDSQHSLWLMFTHSPPALPLGMFSPILLNLSKSIKLCRDSEKLQHHYERENQAARAEAAQARQFNSALLNAIPIAVYYSEIDGTLLGCNASFSQLTGLQQGEIAGKTVGQFPEVDWFNRNLAYKQQLLQDGHLPPFTLRGLDSSGAERLMLCHKNLFFDLNGKASGTITALVDITETTRAEQSLKASLVQTISSLSRAMASRDRSAASHEKRTQHLALRLGQMLGLNDDQLEGLLLVSVVHDIGQIETPSEILTRPRRLTREEFDLVKLHAQTSYDILRDIDFPWPIARIALQHHENYDGSGYPSGLQGDAILLEARILRVADSVEAMLSHRPFRRSYSQEETMTRLKLGSGTLYDPRIVDACLQLFSQQGYHMPDAP
ncbi:HD domain-containing phosphohydrolase [Pokkaliibacter sp. MBI-7]|uniref:HD domain-containing phosphohydrolase n=1 Tax=Pokkaliibacter sp. MBI-7 TaxID=3040600 RepID=UPI00244A77D5|nr:HD domain-containing phosphohydrolase [Pokkaliibacter sp. MBI-7]MDH2436204.1 HD domain-containing phosphohydrolase [Pokkaliibacter sp. MBI-7]